MLSPKYFISEVMLLLSTVASGSSDLDIERKYSDMYPEAEEGYRSLKSLAYVQRMKAEEIIAATKIVEDILTIAPNHVPTK